MFAFGQGPSSSLDQRVRREISAFKGKVALFARNLETGQEYSFSGDERVRTASTIKIAVMIEAFARVADGRAEWTDRLELTKAARYSGSGVLQEMADGLRPTLRDCVNLMMTVSDNTATNMVLDVLTTDAVNARMDALGFKKTRIMRKIGGGGDSKDGKDPANQGFGIGVATPHEMVRIMDKLDRGEIVSAAASKEMIELMKREQARFAIARDMADVPMASKYGALDRLRSSIAILYSKQGKIAMAITVDDAPEINWSVDNPAYLLISRLSEILAEGLANPF
jgi:beta-lactamase class A